MADPKERPILFSAPMVRAILEGRIDLPPKIYANPLVGGADPQVIANRLMNGVEIIDDNGCWLWGRSQSAGYGCMTVLGATKRTHVLSWWVSRRSTIPKGHMVCHKCDVPRCINPDHLFLGTQSDNMRDMAAKGRHGGLPPPMLGEKNPAAKLSPSDVDAIRLRLRAGEVQRCIAEDFGVSQSQISNIKRGVQWG